MKLYLNQFSNKEFIELPYTVPQERVSTFLEDDTFTPKSDLNFQLKAHKLGSTIQITGNVTGSFNFECGRCLQLNDYPLNEPVEAVYVHKQAWDEDNDDLELSEEDVGVWFYTNDYIDLNPSLRDVVLLALPVYTLCPDEQKESCDQALSELIAQANLDTERIQALEQEEVDERWAKLKDLKIKVANPD